MGYQLAHAAYAWCQIVTPRELNALVYMALCAMDDSPRPSYFGGHGSLALRLLGRDLDPDSETYDLDRHAIARAVSGLLRSGAISYRRKAGAGTPPEYWLHLNSLPLPVDKRVQKVVDITTRRQQRHPTTGAESAPLTGAESAPLTGAESAPLTGAESAPHTQQEIRRHDSR